MYTRGMVISNVYFFPYDSGRQGKSRPSPHNTFITRTGGSMYCRTRKLRESYEDHKQVRLYCAGEM